MSPEETQRSDEELVIAALAGDQRSYGGLVSRYAMAAHGLCVGVVGLAAAEEVAHDAFVEAWLKLASLRDPGRFAPWLRTLTLNLCRQWLRQRRAGQKRTAAVEPDDLYQAEAEEAAALDSLCRGLNQLSSAHRLALALHYDLGLKYEEIAAFLDVPAGTVMSRLHRARSNLREWMDTMPETGGPDSGGRSFTDAVEAEIEVLLRLWKEQSRDTRGRFFSEAGKRLSVLVANSPDTIRDVLATMETPLVDHASLLLHRAGGEAIAVAATSALVDEDPPRSMARRVLRCALEDGTGHHLVEPYFVLPLRRTATWVLDTLGRSPAPDSDKAELLVELLPGCRDDASHILLSHGLRAYGEEALPLLLAAWERATEGPEAHLYAAALGRFGSPAHAALGGMLDRPDTAMVRRALEALQAATTQLGGYALSQASDGPSPDRALEWRVSGRRTREELDAATTAQVCDRLEALTGHDDVAVRDLAIACLGELGDASRAPAVRACLSSPTVSTRHAAVVASRALGDTDGVPEIMRLAAEDEPSVRRVALQALGQLGAVEALDMVAGMLDDEAVRADAVSALGELGGEEAERMLQGLTRAPDKKVARLAARALYGGRRTERPPSELRASRLARVRGPGARPLMHISPVAAIRHLPEVRPYQEKELTRLIGEVCGDYSTTRRELVMGKPGLMVREGGVYELSNTGKAVWRVERFLTERAAMCEATPAQPRD